MISKQERKKIIKVLGKKYSAAVSGALEQKKIRNKQGHRIVAPYIRKVMNGFISNKDVEDTIFELVATTKKYQQAETEKRAQILNTKKAVALTTA